MRGFPPLVLAGLLTVAGCASGTAGTGGAAAGAEGVEGHPRVEFLHYMWLPESDAGGKRIPVAQIRVTSASGGATRDYWVRSGDRIGRRETAGDYDTGLTVVKIDKGDRPLQSMVRDKSGWVLIPSYYLLAKEEADRSYVIWLADGRALRPEKAPPR